jgi:peptidoglycan hydrolase-like protein with peptidoglycan-binding domain
MTSSWRRLALGCVLMLTAGASATAQEHSIPVMRIGDWVEIGGALPIAVVYQAEQRLTTAGFDPGAVDGMLDARTTAALRQYQQRHGLPVSGTLDAATRHALGIK